MCLPVFNQRSSGPKCSFQLTEDATKCLTEAPANFLGQILAATQHSTRRAASAKLKTIVTEGLKKIDN